MKKLLLVLGLSLAAVVSANAQEVGKLWVGGTAGVGYTKVKNSGDSNKSGFNFQVLPEIGYVLTDKASLGITVGYGQTKYDKVEEETVDKKVLKVKPFVRYSFLKFDRVSVFTEGGIGYEWGKTVKHGPETNTFEVGLRPGLALHLSDNIKFITKVGFMGYTYTKKGKEKTHDLGLNVNMENVLFGVNVYF